MGLVRLTMGIANPAEPEKVVQRTFLIDSGAMYSVAPAALLRKLGIKPDGKESFTLANGDLIERQVGNALFVYGGRGRAAPVIFGEPGDAALVGVVTLEALGLALDPFKRELRPLPSKAARTSRIGTSGCRTSGICQAKWKWPSSIGASSITSRVAICFGSSGRTSGGTALALLWR